MNIEINLELQELDKYNHLFCPQCNIMNIEKQIPDPIRAYNSGTIYKMEPIYILEAPLTRAFRVIYTGINTSESPLTIHSLILDLIETFKAIRGFSCLKDLFHTSRSGPNLVSRIKATGGGLGVKKQIGLIFKRFEN